MSQPATDAPTMRRPEPSFVHLGRLTDSVALAEHVAGTRPLWDLGYRSNDAALALVLITRHPSPEPRMAAHGQSYLDFLLDAVGADGRVHGHRDGHRTWTDEPACGDAWGQCVWALGTVVSRGTDHTGRALRAFTAAARRRSPELRPLGYAGLGAAEVLRRYPNHHVARSLLIDAALAVDASPGSPSWPWPGVRTAVRERCPP